MPLPSLTPGELTMAAGLAGKVFIDFADSLPPLPPTAGWWHTLAYNFVQRLASNSAKIGPKS